LHWYAQKYEIPFVSVDDIIDNNTLVPCLSRFLDTPDEAKLIQHHIGDPVRGIVKAVGLRASMGAAAHRWAPGICLDCLADDLQTYGRSFWRRDFLLPEIRWCGRHDTPVYRLCASCIPRFGTGPKFETPYDRCFCNRPLTLKATTVHRYERDVARGWHKFLDSTFAPYVGFREISVLTTNKARELGLVEGNEVHWHKCEAFFGSRRSRAFGTSIEFLFNDKSLEHALRGRRCLRHPVHAIFLLVALYGSWEAVEELIISESERQEEYEYPSLGEDFFTAPLEATPSQAAEER
jgi:hypothetical protein